MPANYAHYRFGASMLETMPADIQRTVKRFRRLFDVGLHGPDLFFYHNPLPKSKTCILGSRIHNMSGKEFFSRVCRGIRLEPSEAAEAYLYGVFCHYVLDATCRPFVTEQEAAGVASRVEIETEFDRFLLELDGKVPPERQNISMHLHLRREDYPVVARFYPGATEKTVATGLRNMALALRGNAGGDLVKRGLSITGWEYGGAVMTKGPDSKCCQLDQPLLELYQKAQADFPELLLQLNAHLTYNAPLSADFLRTFY